MIKTIKIVSFLVMVLLISSCMSVQKHLELNTKEILEAIRNNDLERFKEKMDSNQFNEYRSTTEHNFKLANTYIEKYFNDSRSIDFVTLLNSPSPPFMQSIVQLYNGFDSTSGVKSAKLILDFRPKSQYSKDCVLLGITVNEEVDMSYYRYLLDNKLIPNDLDTLIKPLDSVLENERKKIKVFE